MTFITGRKEFATLDVPAWLTVKEAMKIYDELKEMLQAEIVKINSDFRIKEEEREKEFVVMHYRMQDILWRKYAIEEEHIKKVLIESDSGYF